MATGTNKETAPKETAPATIAGDGGKAVSPRRLKLKSPNKNKWLVALIIIAIVIGGWWLLSNHSGGAVFKINGKSYSQAEVKQLASYQQASGVTYKTAARNIYNALCYQAAAQSAHITVSQSDEQKYIENTIGASDTTYKKYKAWFDVVAYNAIVKSRLPAPTKDNRQGYVYNLWFGDAVQPYYGYTSPKYGNQKAYTADQQYANRQATYYHAQLKNKKMSPAAVYSAITKNPKLSPLNKTSSNYSVHFGTSAYGNWAGEITNQNMNNYIKTAAANSLSPIETGQVATTLGPSPKQYRDAYYYIILLQKTSQPNIAQQFHNAQAHLNAKYYGV